MSHRTNKPELFLYAEPLFLDIVPLVWLIPMRSEVYFFGIASVMNLDPDCILSNLTIQDRFFGPLLLGD